jgi:two-component system, chemotaxis family, protein-glutamate methylesterase/glutaminase
MISDILRKDPAIDLVGVANNGKDGAQKAKILKPDIIISDMIMPEGDGLYVVKKVLEEDSLPIILLSSLTKEDKKVFDALEAGAFDFLEKPRIERKGFSKFGDTLINLVKTAADSKVENLKVKDVVRNNHKHVFSDSLPYQVVTIGASTGGPAAIEVLIKQLPSNFPLPVIIVQHMPEGFIQSFAKRIDMISPLPVKLAKKGEEINNGVIYIVPGHVNTIVKRHPEGKVIFSTSQKEFNVYNHPSIDCLFESIAKVYNSKAIGVVLTGMGKDGAEGLLSIKKANGFTLAQDEATSIVYGMPKAAKDNGAVKITLKIDEIAGFITNCL